MATCPISADRLRALDPARVETVLQAAGFTLFNTSTDWGNRWLSADTVDVVAVPNHVTDDYARRMHEVVDALVRVTDRACIEVLADLEATPDPGRAGAIVAPERAADTARIENLERALAYYADGDDYHNHPDGVSYGGLARGVLGGLTALPDRTADDLDTPPPFDDTDLTPPTTTEEAVARVALLRHPNAGAIVAAAEAWALADARATAAWVAHKDHDGSAHDYYVASRERYEAEEALRAAVAAGRGED